MSSTIGWTLIREWPWTHTVFFVLHGIVMLMKQHAYAFYNGHLSTIYARRLYLISNLKELEAADPAHGPARTEPFVPAISTTHLNVAPSAEHRRHHPEGGDIDRVAHAIASRQPLSDEQVQVFAQLIKWEIDALGDELQGTASDFSKAYPNNLTFLNHYKWIPLPTLVYEIEYPRNSSINWSYVVEKLAAMIGVMFVMIQVSQHSICKSSRLLAQLRGSQSVIDPAVMKTVQMKEDNLPLVERFKEFPWLLSDLIFPFMMEYLVCKNWYRSQVPTFSLTSPNSWSGISSGKQSSTSWQSSLSSPIETSTMLGGTAVCNPV